MSSTPLLDELTAELDLYLELDDDLTVLLPPSALQLSGLQLGEPLVVDIHPLSLRLNPISEEGALGLEGLACVDAEGKIHLPFDPPRLSTSRRVLLQLRRRGPHREIHLLADPR